MPTLRRKSDGKILKIRKKTTPKKKSHPMKKRRQGVT